MEAREDIPVLCPKVGLSGLTPAFPALRTKMEELPLHETDGLKWHLVAHRPRANLIFTATHWAVAPTLSLRQLIGLSNCGQHSLLTNGLLYDGATSPKKILPWHASQSGMAMANDASQARGRVFTNLNEAKRVPTEKRGDSKENPLPRRQVAY